MNVRFLSGAVRLSSRRSVLFLAAVTLLAPLVSCSGVPTEEAASALSERCDVEDLEVPVEEIPQDEGVDGFILGAALRL